MIDIRELRASRGGSEDLVLDSSEPTQLSSKVPIILVCPGLVVSSFPACAAAARPAIRELRRSLPSYHEAYDGPYRRVCAEICLHVYAWMASNR